MLDLRSSSASKGISNFIKLYPAKSQSLMKFIISSAISLNNGLFLTFSFVIPCILMLSSEIGICGLISQFLMSLLLSILTFNKQISIILSFVILKPVVSKSKKTNGFLSLSCIFL